MNHKVVVNELAITSLIWRQAWADRVHRYIFAGRDALV